MGAESWGPSIRAKGSNVKEYKLLSMFIQANTRQATDACEKQCCINQAVNKICLLLSWDVFAYSRSEYKNIMAIHNVILNLKVQLKQTWPKWDHKMTILQMRHIEKKVLF